MTKFQLVATSAMGLESIVADEVKALGYETKTENGKIYFEGDERAIARTNLYYLRTQKPLNGNNICLLMQTSLSAENQ